MTQSAYSYYGSRIHLVLEDDVARDYNRAVDAWYEAQSFHEKIYGRKWDPVKEPYLRIAMSDKEKKAYDDIGKIINLLVKINGGGLDIPEEEITSDYLVKLD
jgi:hypothetical protein